MNGFSEDKRLEQLIQEIFPHAELARTWPLQGGISAEMTAFEIALPDGQTRRMILRRPGMETLKREPTAATDEFRLLQMTRSLGLPTQTPYHLDAAGEFFSTPCLVIEYIEGETVFSPTNSPDFIPQMAAHLARIHQVDSAHLDLDFLSRPGNTFELPTYKCAVDADNSLGEARIREVLEAVWPLTPGNAPRLLHGDYWPGNILWREGKIVAVIDWEAAKVGDPLADLAITRLDILTMFGIDAMKDFTDHYRSLMALDYGHLPYWDLWSAIRLLRMSKGNFAEWAAFFPAFGRPDITEQTLKEHFVYFINQAFEALNSV
jgi:aminoglycoside phosphotransferase (APT) family kinase protein